MIKIFNLENFANQNLDQLNMLYIILNKISPMIFLDQIIMDIFQNVIFYKDQ